MPAKEDRIKFSTKKIGIFEILEPQIEKDELFDANLLEKTVNSLVDQGKRNFAIDLSRIDYIYSDSINKFINLNHKILSVYGRLTLLTPSEPVDRILKRAGIQNFLQIYRSLDELQRASLEIVQQTASLNLNEIPSSAPQSQNETLSEFEDLRSEISKAIKTPEDEDSVSDNDIFFPPQHSSPASSTQFDFSQSDPQQTDDNLFAPPNYQYQETPPPSHPSYPPQQQQQDYTQQSQYQQPFEQQPMQGQYRQTPPAQDFNQQLPPDFSQAGNEPSPPQSVPKDKDFDSLFDEDRLAQELHEEGKKFPAIVAVLMVLIVLVVGAAVLYIFYAPQIEELISGKAPEKPVVVEKPIQDKIPQIVSEEEIEEEPDQETPVQEEKVVKKETPKPKKTVSPSKPKTMVTSTPAKKPAPVPNRIIITSFPTGATVYANGKRIGYTPYTWSNPDAYGTLSIRVAKDGYSPESKNIEYTGGTDKTHFTLAEIPPAPKPVVKKSSPATQPSVVKTPSPSKPEKEESEPVSTTPQPQVASTVTTPPPTPPSQQSQGAPGTIFISSLPPMADVYMDGKKIGKTNIDKLKITAGTHTMRFVKGDLEVIKEMTFIEGENPSQLIRIK